VGASGRRMKSGSRASETKHLRDISNPCLCSLYSLSLSPMTFPPGWHGGRMEIALNGNGTIRSLAG